MKAKLYAAFLLAGVLLASCGEKEQQPPQPGGNGGDYPTTKVSEMNVSLPEEGPLSVYSWKETDVLLVNGVQFSLESGAGEKKAVFKGGPVEDRYFTISCPQRISSTDAFLDFVFISQTQTGSGTTAHLINTVFIEDVTACDGVVTLSKEWAESKGGTFRSNGVIAFDFALPAEAGALESIVLESAGVKFPADNAGKNVADKLTLSLSGVNAAAGPVKAFISVPEKALEFNGCKITVSGETNYSVVLDGVFKIGGGQLTTIKVADQTQWKAQSVVSGEGTEASPYILKTASDIEQMHELMVPGKTVWFRMDADIDMGEVLNWAPLNNIDPYDRSVNFNGNGHTIRNFTVADSKYTSFFGVLSGVLRNLTFDKATSKHTNKDGSSTLGIIAGYGGASNGLTALVENVHVTNGLVSSAAEPNGAFAIGGLFGTIVNTQVKDCSFDGEVINDIYGVAGSTNPDRSASGAIAGRSNAACSFVGCIARGSVKSSKARYTGGIVGWVAPSENTSIKDCENFATVTGGSDRAAGIAGHYQEGTVENCVNHGTISCAKNGNIAGAGGIVGYSGPATIVNCRNDGDVSGGGNGVGGIIGYAEKASSVERCYSTGTISGTGRFIGGIAGGFQVANSFVKNCWSSGKVESTGDQEAGGIIGSMMVSQSVSYCYSTAEVVSQRVAGGIVGRACNNTWKYAVIDNGKNTIEKCIAWNPVVKATMAGEAYGGSGAVVGFTNFYNTLTACWRRPDMEFQGSDTAHNLLADQDDCSPTNPFVMGTTPGTYGTVCCPYHGKAAAATATVSSIATSLGWDSSVWNLSSDLPVLK